MALRDQGRIDDARNALIQNNAYLDSNAAKYNSPVLRDQQSFTDQTEKNLVGSGWNEQRKRAAKDSYSRAAQQAH
jgi:hypothetical protein